MNREPPWLIAGQGLAGTCVAWHLHDRGTPFVVFTDGQDGSSRVAAGLVNPVTGKNFEPSWRIADFLPEAVDFYQRLEQHLGVRFWHSVPMLRLARDAAEWRRIEGKLTRLDIATWIDGRTDAPPGWQAAVALRGGGRLDVRAFLDASRDAFRAMGCLREETLVADPRQIGRTIACEGATGLLAGRYGHHRCAKGEILTLQAPHWPRSHIRIGGGGWLVPIGGDAFMAGATYQWDDLDGKPTADGRAHVEAIARILGGDEGFSVTAHRAGIRPILRRSRPLIGRLPEGGWAFNGLGSKGTLYAPGCARRLVTACLDGDAPEPDLDLQIFLHAS